MTINDASAQIVSARRREMAAWAVDHLPSWPAYPADANADPAAIGCEFISVDSESLPVLRSINSGEMVSSTVYFYGKRGRAALSKEQS